MRMVVSWCVATVLAFAASAPAAAQDAAAPAGILCAEKQCSARLTPAQLLATAEKLVMLGKFEEAKPLIKALALAPGYTLQTRFLTGYIAGQQGDLAGAAEQYKAILAEDPNQTRVRLELGRMMLAMGKPQAADRQFRLAGQDRDLPPELVKTIRGVRSVIRQRRAWRLDVDFAIAPDSNINNATAVDQINVNLGDLTLPLTLGADAQPRSGTGQAGSISAGVRLPVSKNVSALVDFDALGTNYSGADFDDYLIQAAAGPELRLSQTASISAQAVTAQRWYGGSVASRQVGIKAGGQATLGMNDRIGAQIDVRRTRALFNPGYDGWQAGLYTSYEHALSKTLVASTGAFARRDWLKEQAYSSTEIGINLAFGGELSHGINFGLSGSVSHARYDAPMQIFSFDPRRDWRLSGRATLGNRKIRVFGFSPEVSLSYARTESNLPFFATDRTRVRFALARYF